MPCSPQRGYTFPIKRAKFVDQISSSCRVLISEWIVLVTSKEIIMSQIAQTPKPPYYAVIFTSVRTKDDNGYGEMADRMLRLAELEEGFLGVESAREEVGITVSYWKDLASIKKWKENAEHLEAQKIGRESWYDSFKVRISLVERDYGI